jgi:quercetin dioxygenase-like cupin family protein
MSSSASPAKERPTAVATIQIDDARVRVTEWQFAPGAETRWHRHAHDYVVVPMTTGRLLLVDNGGASHANLTAGVSYSRKAGVEHNVINDNDFELTFLEIEMKQLT